MTTRTLKWIAIVSMFCDHFAKIVLKSAINHPWANISMRVFLHSDHVLSLYRGIQYFGRLAFPLFIFLLVEGFFLTKNRWKYLRRLFLFALISEIPFDFGFSFNALAPASGKILEFGYQNVLFSLSIGLLAMILIDLIIKKTGTGSPLSVLTVLIAVGSIWLGNTLDTDYHGYGITAMLIAFAVRYFAAPAKFSAPVVLPAGWRMLEMALLILPLVMQSRTELWALIDVGLVSMYFGQRGKRVHKWFFYAFYPLHLIVLVLIRTIILS